MDTKKIETVLTTVTIDSKVDSGKIDVVVGESAKMDVVKAVNYIQSGKAEIEKAVNQGKTVISDHTTEKIGEFDQNAQDKTGDFNTNAINKTTDFNDNYTAKKDVIDGLVDDASDFADLSKQWAIGEPSEPTGGSSKYWAGQASSSLSGLTSRVSAIEGKIPADASSSNQLADKSYVNTADNSLQSQIDALVVASDVFDIVGTYAELQAYDISTVPVNDIIKVLVDSTHSNAATYYRCVETGGVKSWSYIGSEGAYYTKAESDNLFPTKTITGASLDYTGTTLSLLNPSGTSLSSVTIKSTPDLDGVTIDTNSDDELEAIGTVNKNTASGATAVKYDWIGTLAEYNSQNVETLHPEWVCYITDDVSGGTSVYTKTEVDNAISTALTAMLDSAFPVGSRYITENSTCPLATLIPNSTWVLTSQGRVIQGADSNHLAGTTAEAGLPNLKGNLFPIVSNSGRNWQTKSGVFTNSSGNTSGAAASGTTYAYRTVDFDASQSNSIYGASNTVQPPAEFVNIFKRVL